MTEQNLYPKCNRVHQFASFWKKNQFFHGFIILYLKVWLHRFYIQNAAECTILRPSEKKTPPTAFSLSRVGMHEMVVSYIHDTVLLVYIWQEYDLDQNHTRHNQSKCHFCFLLWYSTTTGNYSMGKETRYKMCGRLPFETFRNFS